MVTETFVYADPDHPDRPTGTIHSPPFIAEDVALLSGLELYEQSLCRCGHPKSVAWHSEMDGWFEADEYVCHACSAGKDGTDKAVYTVTRNTRPADRPPLPPFVLGDTTTSP